MLFHYRHELARAGEGLDSSSEESEHLQLLLNFINTEFEDTIRESDNLREQGLMSYEHLWTVFRPGCTLYAPVFGQPRAFELVGYEYICGEVPGLCLETKFVDFNGEELGTRESERTIPAFNGAEKINGLPAFPIEWHSDVSHVSKALVARGRQFEKLAGMHFHDYTGVALENTPYGLSRHNVEGRIVVDAKTFHRLNANLAFSVQALGPEDDKQARKRAIDEEGNDTLDLIPDEKLQLAPMTDAQCMLASARVRGFSFAEKRWFDFFIEGLSPPAWNEDCFDQLVLQPAQKDLVRALVATHVQQRLGFDDIVKGKGKGLIMVLHGPPGVGKTLTAETVAEYCKRPLYMVSSGDLGTDSSTLDKRLSRILDMASTWKAVLLIDEADVFLERRSLHDMERNSLVSIFLRVVEYYEGILFLTSNRVSTFGKCLTHGKRVARPNTSQMTLSSPASTSHSSTITLRPPRASESGRTSCRRWTAACTWTRRDTRVSLQLTSMGDRSRTSSRLPKALRSFMARRWIGQSWSRLSRSRWTLRM